MLQYKNRENQKEAASFETICNTAPWYRRFPGNRTERFYSYGFSCFWLPEEDPGIVIERKGSESPNLEAACKEPLTPIDEKDYAARLVNDGMVSILKYSIACRRNSCMVRMSNCENNISL